MCDDSFSNPAMLLLLLYFVTSYKSRCGPCKFIGPIFEKMSDEMPEIDFIKVDVDEAEEIAAGECTFSS
jgi:thiol-disulfide isomerase/thioredoxin